MATVTIGSARIDENGKISGGKAGDQTGKEVSTQNWYKHPKGWVVLRPKDATKAAIIVATMKAACANNLIGYDQGRRDTLYGLAKPLSFDCSKITTACETDCSALVRVCCAAAGIIVGGFNTSTLEAILMASGAFTKLTDSKYTDKSEYLKKGDILVTKSKGHTVVVLTDGAKAEKNTASVDPLTLKYGDDGEDVKALQIVLIQLGYSCGKWGADGEFGKATQSAVEAFQFDHKLSETGTVDKPTRAAIAKAIGQTPDQTTTDRMVETVGGDAYIRDQPHKNGRILGVAKRGQKYPWRGVTSSDGWQGVDINGEDGWESGQYAKVV